MQIFGLMGGGWILMAKIDEARLSEMDELLRGQSDLISESLLHNASRLELQESSELFRDLARDSRIYFQVTSLNNELIFSSVGQDQEKRAELASLFAKKLMPPDLPFDLMTGPDTWRAVRKVIKYPGDNGQVSVTLHTALNETDSIAELDGIRTIVLLGALLLSILTSIATAAIVALSTTNLRLFARALSRIDPANPRWVFPVRGRSAEEHLLFSSFDQMMRDLVNARQMQKLFLANASHELKTPVAGMLAALEVLLARERSLADFQAICKELLKSVKHMKRLTGALLDNAQLEGSKSLNLQTVDLRELVDAIVERWKPFAEENHGELVYLRPSASMQIPASAELLDVAISNLIDNAIKYNRREGRVTVELSKSGHLYLLRIEDQGIGMDEETISQLGEIFFRADTARSHRDSFGLGFANAKRILANHSAQLEVKSQKGMGTRILIEFSSIPQLKALKS